MPEASPLVGKIQQMLPEGAYMESLPGVCDTFIPRSVLAIFHRQLSQGDTVLVHAEKYVQGQNKWRVTQVVNWVQSHRAPATGSTSPRQPPLNAPQVQHHSQHGGQFGAPSVVDALVQLVHHHGGELRADCLGQLYSQHPRAQEEIRAAGGTPAFCALHSGRVRFIADRGAGRVTLSPVVETLVQLLHENGGEMPGDRASQQLYGRHPWAKEEVQAAGGLKEFCRDIHGNRLRFHRNEGPGPGPGRVSLVAGGYEGEGRVEEAQRSSGVAEALRELLQARGGEMDGAAACASLYATHPRAKEEVRMAGGLPDFCALHAHSLRFVPGGAANATRVQLVEHGEVGGVARGRPVVDALVQLVHRHGGELRADCLGQLYSQHPRAQEEIRAAGGTPAFCALHSGRVRFIADRGAGRVTLSPVVETLVQLLHENGGEMPGDRASQLLYGRHPWAKEEVQAAGGLKEFCRDIHGNRLRFHRNEGPGPGPGRVSLVAGGYEGEGRVEEAQRSSGVAQATAAGHVLQGAGRGAGEATAVSGRVVDLLVRCVAVQGGELAADAPGVAMLCRMHPAAHAEIRMAGGLRGFCELHSSRLWFVSNGGGGDRVRLRPVVDTLVQLLADKGGEMRESELKRLYQLRPGAQQQLSAAGGLRAFCERYPDRLQLQRHPEPGQPATIRLVRAAEDDRGAEEETAGDVGGTWGQGDRGEQAKGAASIDLFVDLLDVDTSGHSAAAACRRPDAAPWSGAVEAAASAQQRPAAALAALLAPPQPPAAAMARPPAKAGGVEQGEEEVVGRVTKLAVHCGFMESCPGVSDVFLPSSLLLHNHLAVGDLLRARVLPSVRGRNRYKATAIERVERAPPHAAPEPQRRGHGAGNSGVGGGWGGWRGADAWHRSQPTA